MVNIEEVKNSVKMLGGYSDEALEAYLPLIQNAAASVQCEESGDEARAVRLAAAKANYEIALAVHGGDSVTSFQAGDIRITENQNALESAKTLYACAAEDCGDLAQDSGFAFRSV